MDNISLIDKYEKALSLNEASTAFAPLAECYRKSGDLNQAFKVLKKGLEHNPDYILGKLCLAHCYYQVDDQLSAYNILVKIIEDHRDNIRLQKLFSNVCLSLRKYDQALTALKHLLFVNPTNQDIANKVKEVENLVYSNEKVHDFKLKEEFKIVEKQQEKAVEDLSGWEEISLNKEISDKTISSEEAKSLDSGSEEHSREEQGQDVIEQFVVHDLQPLPKSKTSNEGPVLTYTLADLYFEQGHIEKAIEVLEKIIILNPKDTVAPQKLSKFKNSLNSKIEIENIESTFSSAITETKIDSSLVSPEMLKIEKLEKFLRQIQNRFQ